MPDEWSAEPLNLLSPEILDTVRTALEAGMLCGVHAFYGGGRGPEPGAFADLDSYLHAVEKSRPGDWFTLWSVPMLAHQNLLLIQKREAPVTESEFQKAKEWLAADLGREFIAAGYPAKDPPDTTWGDYDWFDHLQALAYRCAQTGEFAVLPLNDLLEEYGAGRWIPKLHLVNAKRPNDQGEVPLGGPY